jgi:uncharacterized membrane protein YphA (DoxX/SURF4 family)
MQKTYLSGLTVLPMVGWRRRILALLRILCGALCAIDTGYRWQAIEHSGLQHESLPLVIGWLAPWIPSVHPHLFAICGTVLETIIACCLLCGVLTNLACMLGIFLTLLGYATTGALGMLLVPGSFDLGILFVFTLAFFGLALSHAGEAYGMHGWLTSRLRRWSFLIEKSR